MCGKPDRRRFARAAGGNLLFADMDQPAQEGAGGQNHRAARISRGHRRVDAADAAVLDNQRSSAAASIDFQVWRFAESLSCIAAAIEFAVGLGARAPDGRAFAAVEQRNWMPARIGDAAHDAIQRIDFPHQMALAEAANGRIAGHLADGRESVRQSSVARPCGPRGRRFAAGMAAADHDDIEFLVEFEPAFGASKAGSSGGRGGGQKTPIWRKCFT